MKLPWQKQKSFFTAEEKEALLTAIRQAELRTSGEVRLYVESKCRFMDAADRAKEIFLELRMERTDLRNATLVYIAVDDKQAAVFGDEGIYQKTGDQYWKDVVSKMLFQFKQEKLVEGICSAISDLGEALVYYFPYNQQTDKNELPDDIVFGR